MSDGSRPLDGQVAVVTGAGTGIGRGAAIELARNGASVVVADIRDDTAKMVHEEITAADGTSIAAHVDVSSSASVDALVAETLRTYGQVDVLVNTAAERRPRPVLEMTDEEWQACLEVTLTGTFYTGRAFARPMVERESGTMIFFASDRGLYGSKGSANYAASKGGVIAFTMSLALELGPHQVTVNAINPGTTPTPRPHSSEAERKRHAEHAVVTAAKDPLGRLSTVEDIAQSILFLATTGGKYMTGQLLTTRMRVG